MDATLGEWSAWQVVLVVVVVLALAAYYSSFSDDAAPQGATGQRGRGGAAKPRVVRQLTDTARLVQRRLGLRDDSVVTMVLSEELLALLEGDETEVASLRMLSSLADCYFICKVATSGDEARIRERTDALGLTGAHGMLKAHRVLCCTTMKGKVAFVRQLKPAMHFDVEVVAARELKPHVRRVAGLGPVLLEGAYPDVFERVFVTPQAAVRS